MIGGKEELVKETKKEGPVKQEENRRVWCPESQRVCEGEAVMN